MSCLVRKHCDTVTVQYDTATLLFHKALSQNVPQITTQRVRACLRIQSRLQTSTQNCTNNIYWAEQACVYIKYIKHIELFCWYGMKSASAPTASTIALIPRHLPFLKDLLSLTSILQCNTGCNITFILSSGIYICIVMQLNQVKFCATHCYYLHYFNRL